MNAHTSIKADDAQLPAMLANIEDLTRGRDEAIELWLKSYDTFHYLTDKAAKASIGGRISLTPGEGSTYSGEGSFTKSFLTAGVSKRWDREGRNQIEEPAREVFEAEVTQIVDRRCWDDMMKRLGFDKLLDHQARKEFEESLRTNPPAFTPENCRSTFQAIWGQRRDMYLRGIANAFMKMDRRFRSHDAFGIGNRLIIERAMSEYGGWSAYERRDTLSDVERIFRELDGIGPAGWDNGIAGDIERTARSKHSLPYVIEGAYFKVRVFKNGNLHLWFSNKALLKQVNELLLEYYRPVEGDVDPDGPTYEKGPEYIATPAKHYGAYFSSPEVAEAVIHRVDVNLKGLRVLEPSAGEGMLAAAASKAGADVTCVEIQPHLASLLRERGFQIVPGDFLQMDPSRFEPFDVILMNPPFDRGRDCDHVRHAYQFLKPGGTLVAVMSARAEFAEDARHDALRELIKQSKGRYGYGRDWQDLPERSFAHAGTNVNTVTLRIHKPS